MHGCLYAPANPKRLPPVAEVLLVFLGLGAPLWVWYRRRLTRRIAHTVHKTIYIEGHAAPGQLQDVGSGVLVAS